MGTVARICSRGFTLIEFMIVLVVMGVLITVAIPAYSSMLVNHRLTSQSNGFLATLHFARSEAIKRNSRVVVCKSTTGENCNTSGGWHQGWLVFDDRNNNASRDDGEALLRRGQALTEGFSMTGNSPVVSYVSYTPLGLSKKVSGAFQAGTITLCQSATSGGEGRIIVITITGRARVEKAAAAQCS